MGTRDGLNGVDSCDNGACKIDSESERPMMRVRHQECMFKASNCFDEKDCYACSRARNAK